MELFSITCTTCRARLKVHDKLAIGQILACPKCESMVQVVPPEGWVEPLDESIATSAESAPVAVSAATTDSARTESARGKAALSESGSSPALPRRAAESSISRRQTATRAHGDDKTHPVKTAPTAAAPVAPAAKSSAPKTKANSPTAQQTPTAKSALPAKQVAKAAAVVAVPFVAAPVVAAPVVAAPSQSVAAVAGPTAELPAVSPAAAPTGWTKIFARIPRGMRFGGGIAAAFVAGVAITFVIANRSKNDLPPVAQTEIATPPTEAPPATPAAAPISSPPPAASPVEPAVQAAPSVPPAVEKPTVVEAPATKPPGEGPAPAVAPAAPSAEKPPEKPAVDPPAPVVASEKPPAEPAATPPAMPPIAGPATPSNPNDGNVKHSPPRAIDVNARLADAVSSVEFHDTPLAQFLRQMSQLTTIPITLDPAALDELGLSADDPVSVKLRDGTAGKVLEAALTPAGLAYVVRDGQLLITRPATPARRVRYAVSDLTNDDPKRMSDLAAALVQLVAPQSWQTAGGAGQWQWADKVLAIDQTDAIHFQILMFCEKLRVARGLAPRSRIDAARFKLDTRRARAKTALSQPVTANFIAPRPLTEIVEFIESATNTNIMIDWLALAADGISPETTLTLKAEKAPLEQALASLADSLQAGLVVVDERSLQLTSRRQAARPELEFYRLGGLITPDLTGESLTERIADQIKVDRLQTKTPAGALRYDPLSQCLIVVEPQVIQAGVEKLIDGRRARAKVDVGRRPLGVSGG